MSATSVNIIITVVNILLLTYAITLAASYLFLAALSAWEMRKYIHKNYFVDYDYIVSSPFAPAISLIAPAFNEGLTIIGNVKSSSPSPITISRLS